MKKRKFVRHDRSLPSLKSFSSKNSSFSDGLTHRRDRSGSDQSQDNCSQQVLSITDPLCYNCKQVNIEQVLQYTSELVKSSGRVVSIARNTFEEDCSLCRLIQHIMQTHYADTYLTSELNNGIYLLALPTSALLGHYEPLCLAETSVVIAVVPARSKRGTHNVVGDKLRQFVLRRGVIVACKAMGSDNLLCRNSLDYIGREVLSNKVNFGVLRTWLGGGTGREWVDMPEETYVIDCEESCIVVLTDSMRYLALSYVWGPESDPQLSTWLNQRKCELPRPLPTTVADAITVTRSVGERYLWVDRYCIPLWVDKQTQIENMDKIYAGAMATIVPLSQDPAESSNSGIYGVSRPRGLSPRVNMSSGFLSTSLPHIAFYLFGSQWMSRAWTFQEGILSKRCLFFTEDQVVLLSDNGIKCEGLTTTLWRDPFGLNKDEGFDARTALMYSSLGGFLLALSKGTCHQNDILTKLLGHYTSRNLSVESDILNAFQGILNSTNRPHLYGIFCLRVVQAPAISDDNVEASFKHGLCWSTQKIVKEVVEAGRRRVGFPSWSWASLKENLFYRHFDYEQRQNGQSSVFVYENGTDFGIWRPLSEHFAENSGRSGTCWKVPPYLLLRVFCTRVSLHNIPVDGDFYGGWQAWTCHPRATFNAPKPERVRHFPKNGAPDCGALHVLETPDHQNNNTLLSERLGGVKIDAIESDEFLGRLHNEEWDAVLMNRSVSRDLVIWHWMLLDWDGSIAKRIGLIVSFRPQSKDWFPVFRCSHCEAEAKNCPYRYDKIDCQEIPQPHGDSRVWPEEIVLG